MRYFIIIISILLGSCTSIPSDIKPVEKFELQRYLGTWYEIARLDHSFERGLSRVSAHYEMNEKGAVTVTNRGFNQIQDRWDEAQGKAALVDDALTGHLKVSFFGPFFGSYVIFELDHIDYQYAFVTSYNKDFLWFLARTPMVDQAVIQRFEELVSLYNFDQQAIIWVDQSRAVHSRN